MSFAGLWCSNMANMALIFRCKAPMENGFVDVVHRSGFIATYLVAFLIICGQENYHRVRVFRFNQAALGRKPLPSAG